MNIEKALSVYVIQDGERIGPYTLHEFTTLFQSGKVESHTLVWYAGIDNWTELRSIESLFEYCQNSKGVVGDVPVTNSGRLTIKHSEINAPYIASHWSGQLSLTKSFWINTVVPLLAFIVLNYNFDKIANVVGQKYSTGGVWLVTTSIFTAFGCIMIWQTVGLWRSSGIEKHGPTVNTAIRAFVIFYVLSMLPSLIYLVANISSISDTTFIPNQISISTEGETIFIKGSLEYGVAEQFSDQLVANHSIKLVALDSEGGVANEANKISETIESNKLSTIIVGQCLSSCTRVFASGLTRTVLRRSNIGFHSTRNLFHIKELDEAQSMDFYTPLVEKGFPKEMIKKILETPAEEMWYAPTIPLYESGFITNIVSNLEEVSGESTDSKPELRELEEKYIAGGTKILTLNHKNIKVPVSNDLLSFQMGDDAFEIFDSVTVGDRELVLVLVQKADQYSSNFEENGYRISARVEILMPNVDIDHVLFGRMKNEIAENYKNILTNVGENLQNNMDKASQRVSQAIESDVRLGVPKIKAFRVVENSEDLLTFEIESTTRTQVDDSITLEEQYGLFSMVNLNNSLVMINWSCDRNPPELKAKMNEYARKFIDASLDLNR
jgi:hypothetical protein